MGLQAWYAYSFGFQGLGFRVQDSGVEVRG